MRIRWGSDIKFSAILFTSPNLDVAVNYAPARAHCQSCEPDGGLVYRDSRTAICLQPYVHVVRMNSLSDLWRGSCMYIVDNTRFRNVDSTQRVRMIFCHQSLCYSQLSLILQFMCSSSQFLAACDLSCWI
jgi:hypothetical protein